MAMGVCKLTGETGDFVRSHLIPLAFTRPEQSGLPLMQLASGRRRSKRWSSWYDTRLVTQAGEAILARLDDWAISTLRHNKLVWSGWGSSQRLVTNDHYHFRRLGLSYREVNGIDTERLRLFLLSLLWRAAATEMPEFSEVSLDPADLQRLGQMLLNSDPGSLEFYPAALMQFSTLGIVHNMPPLFNNMSIPNLPGLGHRAYPIFRFYFDGLVVHFHCQTTGSIEWIRPSILGADSTLRITTRPYEGSWEQWNLAQVYLETKK